VAEGGDETARVDVEEGLRFLVGVDFDVLVGDLLVLEGYPDALDEGAGGVSWLSVGGAVGDVWLTRMRCRIALGRPLWNGS